MQQSKISSQVIKTSIASIISLGYSPSSFILGQMTNISTCLQFSFRTLSILSGAYLLSQKDVFLDRSHMAQLCAAIIAGKDSNITIDLPPPAIWKVRKITGL